VNVVSFDSRAGAVEWATAGAAPAVTQLVAASAVAARAFGLTVVLAGEGRRDGKGEPGDEHGR
jgi:hypothetical protein